MSSRFLSDIPVQFAGLASHSQTAVQCVFCLSTFLLLHVILNGVEIIATDGSFINVSIYLKFIYVKLVQLIVYVLHSQSPKVMIKYKLNKMSWKEQDSTSIWMPACARHVLGKHSG